MKTETVVLAALLVACVVIQSGVCFVQESVPESGSTVSRGEGESVTFYCKVLNEANGTQVATEWFIQRRDGGSPQTIVSSSNFNITGEPLPNPVIAGSTYQTNLTIQSLTSDLDRATLSCGRGGTPPTIDASFILRIYRPPNLIDNLPVVTVEGSTSTVSLRQTPDVFPFPQQFSWTVNGSPANNNSRVTFGYPSVTFQRFERGDAGTYTLTATNYRLDNNSVVVGTDTGSFTLDVQYLPLLVGPEGGNRHAVLEGGNTTLVCASRVNGNPTPTISWMDNNGTTVSDGTGISGSTTLSLTISSVTRYQAGNWTCTAENSPGGTLRTAERQIILTVVVPPSQPISIHSVNVGPTFVRIHWQAPSFRGIPEVSRYVITVTQTNATALPLTFTTTDATRDFNVTRLAPGTMYEFCVAAISEYEMTVGHSLPSDPGFADTATTVPAPVCPSAPTSSNGVITVRWNYTHTGGLDLTQVIVTATKGNLATDVPNGNLTDPSQTYIDIDTFTAGFSYTFSVTAYNQLGSNTTQCDPVTHQIGIPQVPDTPIGVTNDHGGVVLTLRTAVSGRIRPQMFSFIVNFTQTSASMKGSRVLFALEYVDGERHQFTINGLMEGESYLFSAQARNRFGSSEFSGISTPITIVTIPAPLCPTPPTSSGGVITVRWSYTHTGGLKLTQVIVTAYMGVHANIQLDVPNGNLTDLSQMSLDIATFTAGFQYTFQVTAYNQLSSSTAQCDPVMHLIGVPQIPVTPYGISSSPGSVTLTLRTPASGRMPFQILLFIVNFTWTSNSMEGSRTLEASDYVDGEDRQFIIDGLMEGEQYVFTAQTRNQFGFSEFSRNSDFITINATDNPQPSTITIDVAVGIAVGTGTIAFVVGALLVLLYHCISKHRSQLKPESSSHQQQRVDSEYKESPISGREKFELRDNVAYLPVRH